MEQQPSYTDTILLDANRQASEEYKGGNLDQNESVYTNKMGVGVKLNSGDKVSVHSGYISRRGAGADTIELAGKASGKFITLPTLTKTQHQKKVNPEEYYGLNIPAPNYGDIAEEYGCEQYTSSTTDYEIKDNEAYFNISYYKNTNGEGYYHLPRRFDALKSQFHDDSARGPLVQQRWIGLFAPANQFTDNYYAGNWLTAADGGGGTGYIRPPYDCFDMGMSYGANFSRVTVAGWDEPNRFKYCYSNPYRRCLSDIHFFQDGQSATSDKASGQSTGAGWSGQNEAGAGTYNIGRMSFVWKKKNDNSRYTLYVKEVSYFADRSPRRWFYPDIQQTDQKRIQVESGVSKVIPVMNNSPSRYDYQSRWDIVNSELYLERRDPAISEYFKYTETKKLSLEPGNYSPENIAAELTDQLNQTDSPKYVVGSTAYSGYPTAATATTGPVSYPSTTNFNARQSIVSTFTESTCFKTFHTATSVSVERKAWQDFYEGTSLIPTEVAVPPVAGDGSFHKGDTITSTNYLSAYQSIGVKRPELWDAGRKIMKTLGYRYIGWDNSVNVASDHVKIGNYEKNESFVWAQQRPAGRRFLPDGSGNEFDYPAGTYHGGDVYEDSDVNSAAGVVGKTAGWAWKQMINPYIPTPIGYGAGATAVITTSWNWNETNLEALKEFFDVQGKYPELFEGVSLQAQPTNDALATYQVGINVDNARFLHIQHRDDTNNRGTDNWKNPLGTDFYAYRMLSTDPSAQDQYPDTYPEGFSQSNADPSKQDLMYGSDALFFYFDKSRADFKSGGDDDLTLYYGLFQKVLITNPYTANDEYCIGITTRLIGGIPDMIFDVDGAGDPSYISEFKNRTIGFDCHFSAYGTSSINLYAGYLSQQIQNLEPTPTANPTAAASYPISQQTIDEADPADHKPACIGYPLAVTQYNIRGELHHQSEGGTNWSLDQKPVHQYIKYRYVGADNPQISFDTNESKFNFSQLHTPERVGNINNAGTADNIPIVADTNDKVYFLNKRLLLKEYCPDMYPYSELEPSVTPAGNEQDTTYSTFFNYNITPYSIMDSDSGIFLEDFGFGGLTEQDWKETLWNMLGFTYNQFHASSANQELTRQTRINNIITTDIIGKPTTNANVEPADLSQYTTNILGAELRTNQLPCVIGDISDFKTAGIPGFQNVINTYLPGATVIQKSAQINASQLPVKTRYPYFLIKSDIIADTNYLGSEDSGQSLPIIAVVSKNSAEADFFFSDEGQSDFTITAPKTITEIRTQILNPDGSLSKLNDDTSIIYKVVKQNNASLNVAEEMLNRTKKLKK
jgi:hypothetical protein